MVTTYLKIQQQYFAKVITGEKPFEIRKQDDKTFSVGDIVILSEFVGDEPTGSNATGVITYVTNFEQKDGYVVFGFKIIDTYLDF